MGRLQTRLKQQLLATAVRRIRYVQIILIQRFVRRLPRGMQCLRGTYQRNCNRLDNRFHSRVVYCCRIRDGSPSDG